MPGRRRHAVAISPVVGATRAIQERSGRTMNPLPLNVCYYGNEEPLPEQKEFQAGLLCLTSEGAELLYIHWGEHEVLHRIFVAVRDRNWETIPARVSSFESSSGPDSFRLSYFVEHQQDEIDFFWHAEIRGTAEGLLTFSMNGEARSTFLRNRIGLCLLHPARQYSGKAFTVRKDDGTLVQGLFPTNISAAQPIPGTECMRALAFEVCPDLRAEIEFSGDLFQMEDQRNWTDATYKTFSTPLSLPYPVEIRKGTQISQSVALTLKDTRPRSPRPAPREKQLIFSLGNGARFALPHIGLGIASHGQPLSAWEIARLKALHLSHLRVDLHLSSPDSGAFLSRATQEARLLDVPLEVAVFLSDSAEAELRSLGLLLKQFQPRIVTWLIFHMAEKATTERCIRQARQALQPWNLEARFGSGTNAYFYQLHEFRPPVDVLDLITYSIQPQEHVFDNGSLVETLSVQGETVANVRQILGNLAVGISPVTLKPRYNPNATGALRGAQPGELPAEVDVRQMSLFGAVWTVGSLKYLSESGACSLTYYETTGWRGVMERTSGSPLPEKFRSLPGSVFPLYHVLADVGEFSGGHVVPTESSQPLKVNGLALSKNDKIRILVANLHPQALEVTVRNLADSVRLRHLNEKNAQEAMLSPEKFRFHEGEVFRIRSGKLNLQLLPYSVACIDMNSQ